MKKTINAIMKFKERIVSMTSAICHNSKYDVMRFSLYKFA